MADRRAMARGLATAALVGIAVAIPARWARGRRRPGSPYFAGAPLLIAHRGGAALAPENTLVAFERAVDWWRADILELDVQPTRDGEVVVFHDFTVDRTTDGSGPIADLSFDEVRRLDAGYRFTPDGGTTYPFRDKDVRVPTLDEVLRAFPGVRVNIELKDGRVQDRVWSVIRDTNAVDRVLVAAEDSRNRARFADRPVPVSAGKKELMLFNAQLRLGTVILPPRVDALQVPLLWEGREVVTPGLVAAAHRLNLPVHVWTVDTLSDMNRLLDLGVDGIISDRPDRLARVLHDRVGRPLPPGPPDPSPEPFLEHLLLT